MMTNDSAILLMLADRQRDIDDLRTEVARLGNELERTGIAPDRTPES